MYIFCSFVCLFVFCFCYNIMLKPFSSPPCLHMFMSNVIVKVQYKYIFPRKITSEPARRSFSFVGELLLRCPWAKHEKLCQLRVSVADLWPVERGRRAEHLFTDEESYCIKTNMCRYPCRLHCRLVFVWEDLLSKTCQLLFLHARPAAPFY